MKNNNDTCIITLGGNDYELKLSHSVLKKFIAKTGMNMDEFSTSYGSYENMDLLMHLMMKRADKNLDDDTIDDLLDELPIRAIFEKFEEAVSCALNDPDENMEGNPQNPIQENGALT